MIYKFLNADDISAVLKDELLIQMGATLSMIIKAESATLSYMKDFIGQRYLLIDCFPEIVNYSANRNYKVSVASDVTYKNILGEIVTESITPTFYRVSNVIVNYCWHEATKKYYRSISDSTGIAPDAADQTAWEEDDPRDGSLVRMCSDITVFYLHTRVNPRKIPQLRLDMYNQAKEWLTLVKDLDITPDLPKPIDPVDDIDPPKWGSQPQNGHYY